MRIAILLQMSLKIIDVLVVTIKYIYIYIYISYTKCNNYYGTVVEIYF